MMTARGPAWLNDLLNDPTEWTAIQYADVYNHFIDSPTHATTHAQL